MAGKLEGNTEDAPYFQRRMLRSRARRTGSTDVRANRRNGDPLAENRENHAHLD